MNKIKSDGESLSLPEERSKALTLLQDASMLLYGEKKIGKTSFAAQFEDAMLIFFEPGGKWLETYNVMPKNWKQFKAYLKLLEAEPDRFRTIIIDTVDLMYKMCYKSICESMGIEHPQDEDYGSGWQRIEDEFTSTVNRILSMGRGVIFISHAEEKKIKVKEGGSADRVVATMPKQARKVLEAVVDIWAYYYYKKDRREVRIIGNSEISAGHRLTDNFVGIRKIQMGDSPKEGYRNFIEAFETKSSGRSSGGVKIKIGGR